MMTTCSCGTRNSYESCCQPIIDGADAPTAEALMRSRYTAFVIGNLDHIERTHAPEVRDQFDRLQAERIVDEVTWLGLEVRRVIGGRPDDEVGQVEFAARYKQRGKDYVQHELADFRRENGAWVYVRCEMNPKTPPRVITKVGRNETCSCGSGKKYKKCCGG